MVRRVMACALILIASVPAYAREVGMRPEYSYGVSSILEPTHLGLW
jgi:hypothetical protein